MGRASRTKWARRRMRLFAIPGSLGVMIRAFLLHGQPDHGRARKDVALRGGWWFRDQHLMGGKYPKQFVMRLSPPPADAGTFESDTAYPQFPSAAAMMAHFKTEDEAKGKEQHSEG